DDLERARATDAHLHRAGISVAARKGAAPLHERADAEPALVVVAALASRGAARGRRIRKAALILGEAVGVSALPSPVATVHAAADTVSILAEFVHRADVLIEARPLARRAPAGAGLRIAGVHGAWVAVVARDRRVDAVSRDRIAGVGRARQAIVAVPGRGLAADRAVRGDGAPLAPRAGVPVVAFGSLRERHAD